jgi:hypothetical protein
MLVQRCGVGREWPQVDSGDGQRATSATLSSHVANIDVDLSCAAALMLHCHHQASPNTVAVASVACITTVLFLTAAAVVSSAAADAAAAACPSASNAVPALQ